MKRIDNFQNTAILFVTNSQRIKRKVQMPLLSFTPQYALCTKAETGAGTIDFDRVSLCCALHIIIIITYYYYYCRLALYFSGTHARLIFLCVIE